MPVRACVFMKHPGLVFMLYPIRMGPPTAGTCSRERLLPLGSSLGSWAEALGTLASLFFLPEKEVLPSELFIGLRAGRLSRP